MNLNKQLIDAKNASRILNNLPAKDKNEALKSISNNLIKHRNDILSGNAIDINNAKKNGQTVMIDRLSLTPERLNSCAKDVLKISLLPDPAGQIIEAKKLSNGLQLQRIRCPLGVIAMIYESRPNVTIDSACLCLKSGNAVILKGGAEAIHSNRAIIQVIKSALKRTKIPPESVQFIDSTEKEIIKGILTQKKYIDVVIPRGGKGLINFVREKSLIPIIETGASVVHTYVDEKFDLKKAVNIIFNAKTQRPSVCNALDTLLIHEKSIKKLLPPLVKELKKFNVEIKADEKAYSVLKNIYKNTKKATAKDYDTEFLDYILAIKTVKNLDEALEHIFTHSLKHSEAIITENKTNAERFFQEVDAACVYVNASTRFTDGGVFGLGAEIGISTQKLHVRGPFALEGLTSYKWLIRGEGQVRE